MSLIYMLTKSERLYHIFVQVERRNFKNNAPISIFLQRLSGGDTRNKSVKKSQPPGIRLSTRHRGGKLDTSSGSSKLNHITYEPRCEKTGLLGF